MTDVIDPGLPPNELAEAIAKLAESDESAPEPGNNNAWFLNVTLNHVQKPFWDTGRYADYAAVCNRAADLAMGVPENVVLLRIEHLNGTRRVPGADMSAMAKLGEQIQYDIALLRDGPRKARLEVLLDHNLGVVNKKGGFYELASAFHRRAAERASKSGDKVGLAIANFMTEVEYCNHQISIGGDTDQVLDRLDIAAGQVGVHCKDPSNRTQAEWLLASVPIHNLEATIWTMKHGTRPLKAELLRTLEEDLPAYDMKLYEKYLSRITAIRAGMALFRGDLVSARGLANQVLKEFAEQADPEARGTAGIVMMQVSAIEYLVPVRDDKGGAHQLSRMAKLILNERLALQIVEHAYQEAA